MKPIVCIGAAIIDDTFHCINEPLFGTSNPANHHRSAGGVARNVAHHLARLGNPVELIAHFGLDTDGEWLKKKCEAAGIGLAHSQFTKTSTGHFSAILSPSGELAIGASDTHLQETITTSFLSEQSALLKSAPLILFDCNLSISCITWLLEFCRTQRIPCIIEPVSVAKASVLKEMNLKDVLLITPNQAELVAVSGLADDKPQVQVEQLFGKGVQNIWLRKGRDGSEFFSRKETIALPAPDVIVADTTGAGDAALAGWIHARQHEKSLRECVLYGHAMAYLTLKSRGSDVDELDVSLLDSSVINLGIR